MLTGRSSSTTDSQCRCRANSFSTSSVSPTRYATADVNVNGFCVRAGERINLIWGSANLDPAHVEDPLRVDFNRHANTHLTFASGFHRCIGSHLTRLELRLGLEDLHKRIPEYWITPPMAAS